MAQGLRTDPEVRDFIVEHARDWNAKQIQRALENQERLADLTPGIRTIQGIARAARKRDKSGRWTVTRATADELRYVLPALADLCDAGLTCDLTKDEAQLIATLKAYDDMPNATAWVLARAIIQAGSRGQSAWPEEAFLAYTPWRDGGLRYARAFEAGRVDQFKFTGYDLSDEAASIVRRSASKERRR